MKGTNRELFDRFTLFHFATGAFMAMRGYEPETAIAVAVGFEVLERPLKSTFPDAFPNPEQDTLINSTGDVLATAVGWLLFSGP